MRSGRTMRKHINTSMKTQTFFVMFACRLRKTSRYEEKKEPLVCQKEGTISHIPVHYLTGRLALIGVSLGCFRMKLNAYIRRGEDH